MKGVHVEIRRLCRLYNTITRITCYLGVPFFLGSIKSPLIRERSGRSWYETTIFSFAVFVHIKTSPINRTRNLLAPSWIKSSMSVLVMLLYSEVQMKAQKELDTVVGQDLLPEFSDRPSLPYINAILKEVIRSVSGPVIALVIERYLGPPSAGIQLRL